MIFFFCLFHTKISYSYSKAFDLFSLWLLRYVALLVECYQEYQVECYQDTRIPINQIPKELLENCSYRLLHLYQSSEFFLFTNFGLKIRISFLILMLLIQDVWD